MRPTLGAGDGLAVSVVVAVGGIRPPVVEALRGGGMTRRGDGAGWQARRWRLGGRWCVAVVGQIRCFLRGGGGC